MESKQKEELIKYFEAPMPKRKRSFVRQFGTQKINIFHMIRTQISYISKTIWIFSIIFCAIAYYVTRYADVKYIGAVFALIPFLVMLSVTESIRSYRYGMQELELSARFSLKSIILARMLVLGMGNIIVLFAAVLFAGDDLYGNIIYLMVPYFITVSGGLFVVRRMQGGEEVFICFGIAAIVSMAQLILPMKYSSLFTQQYLPGWAIVCVLGLLLTISECYRTIRMTEDIAWN